MLRFSRILIILFTLALVAGACSPITPPDPVSAPQPEIAPNILFIGNNLTSDNLGLDQHIKALAASANSALKIETSSVAPQSQITGVSGGTLGQHWNDGVALGEIQKGEWDVVVLQERNEMLLFDLPTFFKYAREFDTEIRQNGAEPVLYMPWVHQSVLTIDQFAQAYGDIGAELGVKVAPAGLAWERSMQERPELELYDKDSMWKVPNLHGTYLTTCVLFATIFERSPEGLSYRPADLLADEDTASQLVEESNTVESTREAWQITDEEAEFLQRIAWETVQEYQTP